MCPRSRGGSGEEEGEVGRSPSDWSMFGGAAAGPSRSRLHT